MGRMNTHKMPAMPRPTALIPGLLLASLLATGLTGCGQKGPLFIPATPAAAHSETAKCGSSAATATRPSLQG